MIKRILFILFFGTFSCSVCMAQSSDQRLGELLNTSDFFTLKEEYPELESNASEFMRLFSKTLINSLFNEPEAAIGSINTLLSDYAEVLGFDNQVSLIIIMAENFIKTGDYKTACSLYKQLLDQVSQYLDEETVESYREVAEKCEIFKKIPKLTLDTLNTYTVPFKRDRMRLITVPIKAKDRELDFVWDFGASLSLIDEKYAKDLDIEYVEDSLHPVKDGNDNSFYAKLGYVKELRIGDMTLCNVPFYVSSEPLVKDLPIETGYEIKGIIGFPVFNHLKNMTFDMVGEQLTVNSKTKDDIRSNMIYFNDVLIVKGYYGGAPIMMHLDSGNKETYVLDDYYQQINKRETTQEMSAAYYAGAAGVAEYESYVHKDFNLAIGTVDFLFENMTILTDRIASPLPMAINARLGVDVFDKADKVVIDFDNMYLDFETKQPRGKP